MALFGLGYGISRAAGVVTGLLGWNEEERKSAQAAAAMFTMPVDPVGSCAAIAMLGIREKAKTGDGICQAIVVGTSVLSVADLADSAANLDSLPDV